MVCGVSIRKDSLNDHPTSQTKGLILRVHTEWITDTLCGHSSSEGSKINESTREAGARVVYTAHFRPPATGGPTPLSAHRSHDPQEQHGRSSGRYGRLYGHTWSTPWVSLGKPPVALIMASATSAAHVRGTSASPFMICEPDMLALGTFPSQSGGNLIVQPSGES